MVGLREAKDFTVLCMTLDDDVLTRRRLSFSGSGMSIQRP
jgi:hypothetical protein